MDSSETKPLLNNIEKYYQGQNIDTDILCDLISLFTELVRNNDDFSLSLPQLKRPRSSAQLFLITHRMIIRVIEDDNECLIFITDNLIPYFLTRIAEKIKSDTPIKCVG